MLSRVAHTLRQPAVKRMLVGSTLIALSYYKKSELLLPVFQRSALAESAIRTAFNAEVDLKSDQKRKVLYLIHDSQSPTQEEWILEV